MQNRFQHYQEIEAFLQKHFSQQNWQLTRPSSGRGHETYIAQSDNAAYFIKVGAQTAYYQAMASANLTPKVVMTGQLEDGQTLLIQTFVTGKTPTWSDFRQYLEKIAVIVNKTHHNAALKQVLPPPSSENYKNVGLAALARVRKKWSIFRSHVPTAAANHVEETLTQLEQEIQQFQGSGLAASHNDICNGNWLITTDGNVYLIDLDTMTRDDPAHDLGALLWWYYPSELRAKFLELAGYPFDDMLKNRMRVRMALHCLTIILPRANSFDQFNPSSFTDNLRDFKAVVAGEENPNGYQ